MSGKSPHLDQLRIDRSKPASGPRRGLAVFLLVLLVLGAGGAGAYYYYLQANAGLPVHAITVENGGGVSGGAGLDASGYVVARRQATLSAQIIGTVVYLNAEEGEHVRQGDVIARVNDSSYSAGLRQAIAQQRQAKAALDDVAPIYARYQRLQTQAAISTDAFENERAAYDAARAQLSVADAAVAVAQSNENYTTVRAPFAGVVTDKVAQIGEIVSPAAAGGGDTRTGIAQITDMDSLEVQVDVSENYIERVRAGEKATITLNAYPDWQIPASVIAIIPTADQSKGTVKVRIAIEAKDSRILPQMGARVTFLTEAADNGPQAAVITVPLDAVTGTSPNGTVFVIHDGMVEARAVRLGLKTAQSVTILSGLAAGDRIATGDLTALHNGVKIKLLD